MDRYKNFLIDILNIILKFNFIHFDWAINALPSSYFPYGFSYLCVSFSIFLVEGVSSQHPGHIFPHNTSYSIFVYSFLIFAYKPLFEVASSMFPVHVFLLEFTFKLVYSFAFFFCLFLIYRKHTSAQQATPIFNMEIVATGICPCLDCCTFKFVRQFSFPSILSIKYSFHICVATL